MQHASRASIVGSWRLEAKKKMLKAAWDINWKKVLASEAAYTIVNTNTTPRDHGRIRSIAHSGPANCVYAA